MKYRGIAISFFGVVFFSILAGLPNQMVQPSLLLETEPAVGSGQQRARAVVVELFTSEGCSSCPPADQLLALLQREQPVPGAQIIALGEHVDYWDRLGWRDAYSSPQFSRRQKEFAQVLGSNSVYTPQMVVDGMTEFVGSDKKKALQAIAQAARSAKVRVQVELSEPDESQTGEIKLLVQVGDLHALEPYHKTLQVLLAVTEENLYSNVSSGENAGRRINHAAVVRSLKVIGTIRGWQGEAFTTQPVLSLENSWKKDHLTVVVLVQDKDNRRILGAVSRKVLWRSEPSRKGRHTLWLQGLFDFQQVLKPITASKL
jgi:hypothetical protein